MKLLKFSKGMKLSTYCTFIFFILFLTACNNHKSNVPVIGFADAFEDNTIEQAKTGFIDALKAHGFDESKGTVKIIYRNASRGGVQFFRGMGPVVNAPIYNKAQLGVLTEKAENETGAAIKEVKKGTAAEKAGLQTGDIIQKVNNIPIQNSEDLYKAIGQYKPGDTVNIAYLRNGISNTTKALLQKNEMAANDNQWGKENFNLQMPPMPDMPGFNFKNMNKKPMLGVQIEEMDNNAGVKINSVNPNSPAEKAGLQKGDVVTAIDGSTVKSIEDIKQVMNNKKEGDEVSLSYLRNGKKYNTNILFPKTIKKATL